MQFTEAQEKIKNIENDEERDIAELLLNMGFTFIDSNPIILNASEQQVGEIDVLFTFEDYLLLIEVSKNASAGNNKKTSWFTKWEDRSNQTLLRNHYSLRPRKVLRIYFDLATKTPENPSAEISRLTQDGTGNKVAYLDDYAYFLNSLKKIGSWSKNDFLDWLGFEDESRSKTIDAIQYYIGDTPAFCFVENVENLLQSCYVSRRRTRDMGYQRALKKTRVTGISQNIKKGEGLSFPNSILISVPNLTDNVAEPEVCPKIVKIHFPLSYNTCRIIDGQHRLLGFSAVNSETRQMYSLPVIALQDYDRKKEIKTFVDINSKQQKIDVNLILLLKADLEWKEDSKEQKEKIAVGVAQELNKSFLPNRVYFGRADETKGSKITLSTLVSALVGNNQIQDNVSKTYKKIKEIFKLIQENIPKYGFQEEGYFGNNQGIRVLFRLLYLYQRNTEVGRISVSKEDFIKNLGKIMDKDTITELDDLYGEGGANSASTLLVEKLQAKFSKYKDMVTNLNNLKKKKS